jgi:hypothetical protein
MNTKERPHYVAALVTTIDMPKAKRKPCMLELLREHDLPHRFRALKKKAAEVTIAVPFWGDGAVQMLGLGTIHKGRVLCNLTSSACNPYVIDKLKGLKGMLRPNALPTASGLCPS